ncbi:MAG: outer membrane beta-barrel protein [Gammaproteobacteria bacterium]
MLFKKLITCTLFLAVGCQQAFANSFYVGAGAGISSINDKQKTTTVGQSPITHDLGTVGAIGSVLGGYNFDFNNNFNLGLEAFFALSPKKITLGADPPSSTLSNRKADFSLQYAYGVRALPGYKVLSNVVGYAILGVTRGSFSLNDGGAYSITSTKFGVFGYQLGLGSSVALMNNLDARLDFIYTQYANHTTNGVSTYGSLAGSPMTYQDSPTSFSTLLSLTYKFI